MSTTAPDNWSELTVCPSCGAAVANDARTCWLCKWDLADEVVTAEVVGEPPRYVLESASSGIALIVGIVTLGLVTVGVFAAAPGIGVLMGVVFVIATFAVAKGLRADGLVTADQAALKQAYASPATRAVVKRGNVVVSVLKVLGIVVLIIVATIIAFFTFCVIVIVVLSQ